jgi:hypothetical protein
MREEATTNRDPSCVRVCWWYPATIKQKQLNYITMENLVIKGTAVFGIKKLAGKFAYDTETEGFKDKFYYRYRANGRVFVVHEHDDFNEAYDNKVIAELHLIETPSKTDDSIMQLSLDYFVTQAQLINHTSFEAKIDAIKTGATNIKVSNLNEVEDLS